jgi:Arc/MetJ family transcription regulator
MVEVVMSVTQVDLDDEALNEAMRLLGTKTKKETINMALREVVQRMRRMEAFDRILEKGQRGHYDQAAEAHAAAKRAWKQAWADVPLETQE